MVEVWYENPPGSGPAQGLYSNVGRSRGGTHVFIAGQLSVGDDGSVVGVGDFVAQFHQVYSTLGAILNGLGGGWQSVVKFTTYLASDDHIPLFMTERQKLFPTLFQGDFPPNTLLVVKRLVKPEFLIEVEAVAAVDFDSNLK